MLTRCALGIIWIYQRLVSPLLPRACRFYPSCSEYSRESLVRYGFCKGTVLALQRLAKCHPFHPGGCDPVP